MEEIMKKINERSEFYKPQMVQFLRDMIAIPSTSCKEKAVVLRIKEEMEKVGFDEIKIDEMGNILGRIGNGKRIIAMDAHIDTVDVGDPELWKCDPFKGEYKNGIIYGRGASDQEAGMAGMVYAGKIIKELKLEDDYSLYVVGSVMEEDCDGLCWQYILKENILKPECVIITEPTNLNLYRGHRGRMEIHIITKGVSCHGSAPERGVNAIYKMAPIISDIEKLNEKLKHDDFLGKGTVTISQIFFKSPSQCAVADECTIHLDRRLTDGETKETVFQELKSLPNIGDAQIKILNYEEKAYTGLVYPTEKYYPTWVIPEDHELTVSGVETYKALFNKEPKVDKWVFSTNGVSIMGMFGIPCLGFGPANEIHAHSPEDQIHEDHLSKACAFYVAFPKFYLKNAKR